MLFSLQKQSEIYNSTIKRHIYNHAYKYKVYILKTAFCVCERIFSLALKSHLHYCIIKVAASQSEAFDLSDINPGTKYDLHM